MNRDRYCRHCSKHFLANTTGEAYCADCKTFAQQARQLERRLAKQRPNCECGKRKHRDDRYCESCKRERYVARMREQAQRSAWQRSRLPSRLPVAPLMERVVAYVERHAERNECGQLLAEPVLLRLGISVRRYYEWRNGRTLHLQFDIADKVLTAAGWDWLDVWDRDSCPELVEALEMIDRLGEAEADGFCPECSEWVASINSTCPWHERPVRVELGLAGGSRLDVAA